MIENFAWYLRECALREYAIWSENYGDLADRAYDRCMRFMALADFLHRTRCSYDLEYEYQCRRGMWDDEED